jgi:hypothetical protein
VSDLRGDGAAIVGVGVAIPKCELPLDNCRGSDVVDGVACQFGVGSFDAASTTITAKVAFFGSSLRPI